MSYINTLLILVFWVCTQPLFGQTTEQEQNVQIIPQNESQSFMFTNSLGLYYYGETGLQNTSPYHGLSFLTRKLLFLKDDPSIIQSSTSISV